jgi:hypothetical protein
MPRCETRPPAADSIVQAARMFAAVDMTVSDAHHRGGPLFYGVWRPSTAISWPIPTVTRRQPRIHLTPLLVNLHTRTT